jgi:hypothetical protein
VLQQFGSMAQTVAEHVASLHEGLLCGVQQQLGSLAKAVDHSAAVSAAMHNPVVPARLRIGTASL